MTKTMFCKWPEECHHSTSTSEFLMVEFQSTPNTNKYMKLVLQTQSTTKNKKKIIQSISFRLRVFCNQHSTIKFVFFKFYYNRLISSSLLQLCIIEIVTYWNLVVDAILVTEILCYYAKIMTSNRRTYWNCAFLKACLIEIYSNYMSFAHSCLQ